MRRIYWCFAAIGSMAIMGTVAACSSDDSSTSDAGPALDGGGSDVVTVKDSGGTDSGTADAGPCVHCAQLITGQGSLSKACTDSITLAVAAIKCACNNSPAGAGEGKCDVDSGTTSADGGVGACGAFCASPTTTLPDSTCIGCGADNCTSEFSACEADTSEPPVDAGSDADAG